MTVKVTYSSGATAIVGGWTHSMVERMRQSWAEIRDPRSTATIEIISEDDISEDEVSA